MKRCDGIYRIVVYPENDNKGTLLDEQFCNRKEAETFAGIETIAGMGETHEVVKEEHNNKHCLVEWYKRPGAMYRRVDYDELGLPVRDIYIEKNNVPSYVMKKVGWNGNLFEKVSCKEM